jgi:hypothetical protein
MPPAHLDAKVGSGTAASTPPRLARTHGEQIEAWGGFAQGKNNLFTDPVLTAIGNEHGKTVASSCCAGSSNAMSGRSRS